MRLRLLLPALLLLLGASLDCQPTPSQNAAPRLGHDALQALLIKADAAREQAYENGDPAPLRGLFADTAIVPLLPRLARLHKLGERLEERDRSRKLVHWVAGDGSAEGALEVQGEERMDLPGRPPGRWSRILRQWYATVRWSGGRWLVVDARDLPPPQWWHG